MSGYVAVVGGVNIDIGGRPFSPLVPRDSNPGSVTVSLGGVGRNIAHNLSLLGAEVQLLTAFGDDVYAMQIEAGCAESNIDIHRACKIPGAASSVYLYLSDEKGDMALALSDMAICDRIDVPYLEENRDVLDGARLIVADANLPEASLSYLAEMSNVPLFVDPVSTAKAHKLPSILHRIHTMKPNAAEAETLSGVKVTDEASAFRAADILMEKGVRRVFLSLGKEGICAVDGGQRFRFHGYDAVVRSATGAGDAFMAALSYAYLKGMDLKETVLFSAAAATLCVECTETVNASLTEEAVRERMKKGMR